MVECLPLGSFDASTLRMLLEKERARTQELEQLVAGLTEPGTRLRVSLLRQQVAALQSDNERRRGTPRPEPHQASPWPSERTKQDRPYRPIDSTS